MHIEFKKPEIHIKHKKCNFLLKNFKRLIYSYILPLD